MKNEVSLQEKKLKLIEALMSVTDEVLIEKLHIVLQQGKKSSKKKIFTQDLIDSLDERWADYKNGGATYSIAETRNAAVNFLKVGC